MNCKAAEKLISRFIDGELRPEQSAALTVHLASCQLCAKEMEVLNRTMTLVDGFGDIEPSFNLADIRNRAEKKNASDLFGWFFPMPRLAIAAMVFVALLTGSVSGVYYGSRSSRGENMQVAAVSQRVADTFGLDAFDGGLSNAIYDVNQPTAASGEAVQ